MKNPETIPQCSIDINNRFFLATEHLQNSKEIRGLGTLAKKWGVNRSSLSWSKNHPDQKRVKIELIYYLSRDFGISLDWIFFGSGPMLARRP